MKRLLPLSYLLITVLLIALFPNKVNAQASSANYTFSTVTNGSLALDANGNAIDMSTGTSQLVAASADQTVSSATSIGFNFLLMGNLYTHFTAGANGMVGLGSTAFSTSVYTPSGGTTTTPLIAPFGSDLQTGASGKVHCKLIGSAPNRCLVVEFLNMSIYYDATSSDGTFQCRLYETTGIIEFVYGAMTVSKINGSGVGSIAPAIGFATNTTATNFAYVTISSNTATTTGSFTANPSSTVGTITNLNSASDGSRRIYKFTPSVSSLAAPTSLNFTSVTATSMVLNWTAASPTTNVSGYVIQRSEDGGTTYTSQGSVSGVNTVTYSGTGTTGLQPGTTYHWRILSVGGEASSSANLDGSQSTSAGASYFWVGTTGGDWNTAANWNTASDGSGSSRDVPATTDVLTIDGDGTVAGGSTTISITTSQSIGALKISGNTAVTLQSNNTTTKTITITGGAGADLDLPSGNSLLLTNSTNAVGIVFSTSANMTGNISGTLTLGNSANNTFVTTGVSTTVVTVSSSGIINNGPLSVVTGSVATLSFASGSTYNHLYTTTAGTIPTATYNSNSNVNITGYTTSTTGPSGMTSSTFGNFTWNCTNQGSTVTNLGLSSSTVNIAGTFTVTSTGTSGSLALSSTGTGNTINAGNFAISAGTLNFGTSTSAVCTLKVAGTFNQSGGTITETGSGTSNTIEFNGTSAQAVTLGTISNTFLYRVNNNSGITLTGTLGVTTGAGLLISSTSATPISGGTVTYTGTTTLTYNGTGNQTINSTIFPNSSGPTNLVINNTGTAPNNRVDMASTGDRTLTGTFTQTSGVFTLGNNSLTVTGAISGTASSTNFVATNGTGELKKIVTTTGTTTFPLGDVTGTDEASPVALNFTAFVGTSSTVGVKVSDAQHPDDASVTDFLSRFWSFTETGATSYTYTSTFTYPNGEVTGSASNMRLFARNSSTWTSIGSSPSATSMSNVVGLTNTSMPLNSTSFTGRTFGGAQTYVWNQTSDAAYNTSSNWTPTRTSPDPADILQFSNGGTYNVTAFATETIGKLEISGNTTVTLQSGATATMTIGGGTGDDLSIASGSTLVIGGANTLTIAFSSSTTSQIDGTLEVVASRTFNATNSTSTVGNGGIIKNAGTVTSSTSNLTFASGGKYQHNYTTSAGTVPTATWNVASTLEFIGYTTNTTATSGLTSQTFGNIVWNCASQSAASPLSGLTITAAGNFTMTNSGSGSLVLSSSSSATTLSCVNFTHNGGTLNFGSSSANSLLRVSGTITYNAGTITETGTGTTNAFEFNGSSLQTLPTSLTLTNDIGFRINNNAGVNIGDGTGTLILNTSAAITMVTGAINGTVTYGATGLLVYNGSSAQTATGTEFPNTNGPFNLTVNNSTGLTIPFDRSVGGTLTMTVGNILIGSNTLTLGTSATVVGTLTYTAGLIIPTTGKFARWYGASGAPTATGTTSRFPLGTSLSEARFVHIFPSSATSFSGGGGVFAVAHTNNGGLSTVTDFTDNTITVNRRSNGFWTITTPVTPTLSSGTISVQAQGTNMISTSTVANLRLTNASASIPGGNSTGSGTSPDFTATKPGITTINDVTANPIYIAGNNSNIFGIITAIATGNWGDNSTWNSNSVPTISDNVIIPNTFAVTMASGTPPYSANGLTINSGGSIISSANTLTIGTTGGGNKLLSVAGTLTISGGNIEVNGNVNVTATGTFNQSSGDLTIDGNDGVSASTSVAEGTHLLNYTTASVINCTGGNIKIIDPPFSSTTTSRAVSVSQGSDSKTAFSGTHTFVFGDGVSTTVGGSTNGFVIDNFAGSGRVPLNHVTINSGNATGRFVRNTLSTSNGTYIYGTLTINSGSEFRFITNATDDNVLGGNLVNNGTFTQAASTFVLGAIPSTVTNTVTASQTVSGSGVFQNATSSPTANFANLQINNSNAGGVIISTNTALSGTGTGTVSGTLTMTAGILNVGSNTITVGISTASTGTLSYTAGQIIGKLKRWKAASTGSLTYNLGSSSIEQRATINFTTGPTTGGSITGEFISTAPGGSQPASLVEGAITIDRAAGTGYWSFSTGDGFAMGSGVYTGTFIAKNFTGVSDFSKLVTIRRDDASSAWALNGTHVTTTGSNATATLSRTAMTSFGHIGVGGTEADNPLPIELISFSGVAKSDFNALSWATASEINSDYFEVQKLNTEKEFENIARVSAAGNSKEINKYQFHDANINRNNSIDYYRLKLVDRNNSFQYSDVIAINRNEKAKADLKLYPNPSTDVLNIFVNGIENENVTIQIIDMFGKVILEQKNFTSSSINVNELPTGLYQVQIIGLTEVLTQKFIKK